MAELSSLCREINIEEDEGIELSFYLSTESLLEKSVERNVEGGQLVD